MSDEEFPLYHGTFPAAVSCCVPIKACYTPVEDFIDGVCPDCGATFSQILKEENNHPDEPKQPDTEMVKEVPLVDYLLDKLPFKFGKHFDADK